LASEVLAQALTAARAVGYAELIALATVNLAEAFLVLGDLARAEEAASTALGYFAANCIRRLGAGDRFRR